MPKISVSPTKVHSVAEGSVAAMKLTMMWGKQGGGLITGGSYNVVAVYDLELYLRNQRRLKQRAGGSGFFEVDDRFFTRGPQDFPGAQLRGHEIAAGTGVMFLADVKFRFTDDKHWGMHWHVENVAARGEHSPKPFALDVQAVGRFDDQGNALSSGSIEMRSLGQASVARSDYEAFFAPGGSPTRRIAVRVFTADLGRVLLSSFNPEQSTAGWKNEQTGQQGVLRKSIFLSRTHEPRNVGDPGGPPRAGQTPAPRLRAPDLTGVYVEELEPRTEGGKRAFDAHTVVAPATLTIHQAGHAIVGWYAPLPVETLGSSIFEEHPHGKMLSRERFAFIGPREDIPAELEVPDLPADAIPILYCNDKFQDVIGNDKLSQRRLDPNDLLDGTSHQLAAGWLRIVDNGLIVVELGLKDGRKAQFLQSHSRPRLAWSVLRELQATRGVQGLSPLPPAVHGEAEPMPAGIAAKLVSPLVGQGMIDALTQFHSFPTERRVAEEKIKKIVDRVATGLRKHHADQATNWSQVVMRSAVIEAGGKKQVLLDHLLDVATEVVEQGKKVKDHGSLARNTEEYLPKAFRDLGIVPTSEFRYVFTFASEQVTADFLVFKASFGGFELTIQRLRMNDEKFVGDPTFEETTRADSARYEGIFFGGGVGLGRSLKPGSRSTKAGVDGAGSGSPLSCVIDTYHEIRADRFNDALFEVAAFVKPGVSVDAAVVGSAGLGGHDTVMTVHITDSIKLTAHVEAGVFSFNVEGPDVEKTVDALKDLKDLKGGSEGVRALGGSATLAGVTYCRGRLRWAEGKGPLQALAKPDRVTSTKTTLPATAGYTVAFARGKSTIEASAHDELDVFLATHRWLFQMAGWYKVISSVSPEFAHGALSQDQADGQNEGLAKFRTRAIIDAVQASIGSPGQGIVHAEKEVLEGIDTRSQVREALEGDDFESVLHPHSPAAKTPEGKRKVAEEERSKYADLRRADLVVNGVLTMTLFGR